MWQVNNVINVQWMLALIAMKIKNANNARTLINLNRIRLEINVLIARKNIVKSVNKIMSAKYILTVKYKIKNRMCKQIIATIAKQKCVQIVMLRISVSDANNQKAIKQTQIIVSVYSALNNIAYIVHQTKFAHSIPIVLKVKTIEQTLKGLNVFSAKFNT